MEEQKKSGRIYRDWDLVFKEHRESGMTVKAFCEERGIYQGLFYKWQKRYREESDSGGGRFVELRRSGNGTASSGVTVIAVRGIRIDLQPDFDAVTLERVLACLSRSASCSR